MTTPAHNPRLALIDVLRGIALAAMIAYHFVWDLSYLGFLAFDITADLRFVVIQRLILGSFLVLAGISLVLGHGTTIRWRQFWRRWAMLVAAAAAMSIGTWFAFGEAFAFFGILHAIALFTLLGLIFLRLPWWVAALTAVIAVTLGATVHIEAFNDRWLAWIGFWTEPPRTADLVAVFPWFGAVLSGIVLGRLLPWRRWTWAPKLWPGRVLRLMGRWSLVVYLAHQPLMLGVLYPLAEWLQPQGMVAEAGVPEGPAEFVAQCQPACLANGGPEAYCTAYCSCALEQIATGDLWDAIGAVEPTVDQRATVDQVITLCRAMAEVPR